MFKVNIRDTSVMSFWSLLLALNIFHTCFTVSIVDFEQVNVSCVTFTVMKSREHFSLLKEQFPLENLLPFFKAYAFFEYELT